MRNSITKKRKREMRNWAGMLPEMLYLICKHVSSFKDLVSFGGVCSAWRHVAVEQNLGQPLLPLPWLMLTENKGDDIREFYSVTEGKTYSFELPELGGKRCMETKGWIVTSSDKGEMALIHPLTHFQIPLPHQNTLECYEEDAMNPLEFVYRAVLSSPPNPQNERECLLMILHGMMGHIGFCRPGDKKWNVIQDNFVCGIESIEYYREKLYVVVNCDEVWEFDVIGKSNDSDTVSSRKIELKISLYLQGAQSYLVQSMDSLLVVIRAEVRHVDCISSKFLVLEIDIEHGGYKVVPSLGTKAIFSGHSATLCVETTRYPGLIPNSVYFTGDSTMPYLDESTEEAIMNKLIEEAIMNMGIYLLEEKRVKPYYCGKLLSRVRPPVWTF